RQRRTGLGWRGLTSLPEPASESTLTVSGVHDAFEEMASLAGAGSQARRTALVEALFARATADEQAYLRGLVTGELRQGALDGLMLEAVAVLTGGVEALAGFGLEPGRPIRPMLASSAADVEEALARIGDGPVAVDAKLDGIRVQVHKHDGRVRVFTRSL